MADNCNWVFTGCDYGRGSTDYNNFRCTTCNATCTLSEGRGGQPDPEPHTCMSPEVVAVRNVERLEADERKELARLVAKYGS